MCKTLMVGLFLAVLHAGCLAARSARVIEPPFSDSLRSVTTDAAAPMRAGTPNPDFTQGGQTDSESAVIAQVQPVAPSPPPAEESPSQSESQTFPERLQHRLGDYRASPGVAFLNPTAYGRDFGRIAIGFAFQGETRLGSSPDAVAGIGMGLGDRKKWVGLDVGLNFLSLTPSGSEESFGERGSFNFKLHRALPADVAVALGTRNVLIWNGSDAPTTTYGVVSWMSRLKESRWEVFSRLYLSFGVQYLWVSDGQGRARRVAEAVIDRSGSVNPFGSVGIKVIEPLNMFAEWTGESLNLGVSFVLLPKLPIVFTPTLADVAGHDPRGVRFILGVGLPFSLF